MFKKNYYYNYSNNEILSSIKDKEIFFTLFTISFFFFFFFYFKIWKDNERKFIKFRYFNWKNLSRSQRRNLFNDKRKKKGEREAEKSVFDKILLKKPSKILSAAEERGGKEEMKRTLITSENREQRSET